MIRLSWFRNTRLCQLLCWSMVTGLLLCRCGSAPAAEPLFFMQLTDPQFGMWTSDADFQQETANFEFAVATANRLRPAFVIVTGDLINKAGDKTQADEYLRIAAKLDRSIPLYHVPGNHDLGNDPSSQSIAAYVARFGPDHYTFRCGSVLGIVLNSCLIKSPQHVASEAVEQDAWLRTELQNARQAQVPHVIVFQHHPWFSEKYDEPDGYNNLPLATRRQYLDLLRDVGVTHLFAGHYHANRITRYDSLGLVATGAIGRPLGNDVSGLRIVIVRDTGIEHRYYHLGEIPNRIDLSSK